ncbi:MAG: acyl-CoA dehydrogenase family protein, partial [Terriglobus roseus]|nr:acyl-CoA dehydrogenase family protein [Terriglobus roseus]
MASKTLTREEVKAHNSEDDLWVIIDHKVYDLSEFLDAHPGGSVVLAQVAGQDATAAFYNLHRHEVLQKYSDLCVGVLEGEKPEVIDPKPGDLSAVPYGEPLWLRPQFASPYYNDSHRKLQKAVRVFVDEHVRPEARAKELDGTYISQELIDRMAANGLLAMKMGPGKHLLGRTLMDGAVEPKDFDYFHDLVQVQEMVRTGSRGFNDGNMAGMAIALSAVHAWCRSEPLRKRI